jgi:hypothetical protein
VSSWGGTVRVSRLPHGGCSGDRAERRPLLLLEDEEPSTGWCGIHQNLFYVKLLLGSSFINKHSLGVKSSQQHFKHYRKQKLPSLTLAS